MSKPAPLTSLNVRSKGEAKPAPDALARGQTPKTPRAKVPTEELVPLSFKVPPAFKKRYQRAALDAGMKLNEFLFMLVERYEAENKKS